MLAPYSTGDSMLLDAKTLVQSESGSFMKAFAELPSVIPRQSGGSRSRSRSRKHRRSRRRHTRQRGGMQEFNGVSGAFATPMGVGMGMGLSGAQAGGRRRSQHGGWAPFDSAFARPLSGPGQNPQFQTEAEMGYGYSESKGPQ
jgi:hypothetical protein